MAARGKREGVGKRALERRLIAPSKDAPAHVEETPVDDDQAAKAGSSNKPRHRRS